MASSAPVKVTNNLRTGGTNISFPFYGDWNETDVTKYEGAIAEQKSKGIRAIRITMSMNNFESTARDGSLRVARWDTLIRYCKAVIAQGLTPIIDNHNTGLRGDDNTGDWESDYMGDLRSNAVRIRHTKLMTEMVKRIEADPALVNEVVFTYANEPIFSNSSSDALIWWNYQKQLVPVLRSAAPNVMMTYMANDWNGIEAFIYGWNTHMKAFAVPGGVPDPRLFVDVHFYEPMGFTHGANANTKYPGSVNTWRGTHNWNKEFMRTLIKPLYDFQKANNLTFVVVTEYGTDKRADKESRLRYLTDLSDLFREYGFGHILYTWSYGDSFQTNVYGGYGDERIFPAVFKTVGDPPVDPPDDPPVDPPDDPPVETDNLSPEERADVLLLINAAITAITAINAQWQAKLDIANQRISTLETELGRKGDKIAIAARALADALDTL